MLYIRNENTLRGKIKSIVFLLFNKLENNNNANFITNGENKFLDDLLNISSDHLIIFDVGANIGKYSEIIIDKCNSKGLKYNLHIFEPSKAAFKILESKFCREGNIYLNNLGASDSNREAEIFFDEEGSSLASLYQRRDSSGKLLLDKKEIIHLTRLDNYIRGTFVKKIDFLKLDIEGHEFSALKGLGEFLNPSFIKALQFEYGGTNLDSKTTLHELYSFLESKGYSVFKIMKSHIEKRSYEFTMENFQYSNYVALAEDIVSDRA